MEDTSSNYSSESEDAEDLVLNYLKTRCYITQKEEEEDKDFEPVMPKVSISRKEAEVEAISRMESSEPCCLSFNTCSADINVAEQQILAFKLWITELEDEVCQKEMFYMIMPLVCNLYIECLRTTVPSVCAKFLTRHAREPVLDETWRPLVDQLLTLQSYSDLNNLPAVSVFRSSKSEIRLSTRTLIALRRFLMRTKSTLLLQILKTRFKVDTLLEGIFMSEDDVPFSPFILRCSKRCKQEVKVDEAGKRKKRRSESRGESGTEGDPELEELLAEMRRMRLRPTPPPPLLLYSTHKTEGVVCGEVCERGVLAATGDLRSELRVWGLSETKLKPQLHPAYFTSVPIQAPTEPLLNSQDQNPQWWSLRGHCDAVYDVAFTSNSDFLLSVSFDTTMRLWNLHDYSNTAVYRGHTKAIWGVAVSGSHSMVATASSDKTAKLWTLDRTFPIRTLAGHTLDVMCCAFHPNGVYVATGSVDRSIRMWSLTDGQMVRVMGRLPGQDFVECVTFSPNGQYLASAGGDCFVWVWDLAVGALLYQLECSYPLGHVSSLSWSPDGSSLAAATSDGALLLWHLDSLTEEGYPCRKYTTKCSTILSVRYSNKSSLVAVGVA